MWWRQAALALNGTAGVQASEKGPSSYTAQLPTPTGRSVQQGGCALWVVGRQAAGDLRQVLQTHGDVEPVKNREATDAGLEEDASQPGAAVGERGQRRILCPPNRVEVAADQRREIRVGLRDGTEHLPASRRRLDVADPDLQVPLAVLTAADERRVQGQRDHRGRRGRFDGRWHRQRLGDLEGMAAQQGSRIKPLWELIPFAMTRLGLEMGAYVSTDEALKLPDLA